MAEIAKQDLNRLMERLQRERGIDFRGYKPASFGRRVTRRLESTKSPDVDSYLKLLDQQPDEYTRLLDTILINVTEFFRDAEAWEIIRKDVVPQIVSRKPTGDQIRMWSAGCATGEEAYSLAFVVAEVLGSRLPEYDVRIYATDVDDDALVTARRGEYSDEKVQAVPSEMREKYFVKNSAWTVRKDIRRMVIFGRHNLASDAPISHVDLVTCRNVLIYMSTDLQNKVLSRIYYGLDPGGFLFLGKAESLLTASRTLKPVNEKWRIFTKESSVGSMPRMHGEQKAVGQAAEAGALEQQLTSLFNEAVLRHTSSGVIALDDKAIVRVMNPAAESIWGVRDADLLGQSIFEANISDSLRNILPQVVQARSQHAEITVEETNLNPDSARPIYASVTFKPILDIRGNHAGIIIVSENVTNQVRLRHELGAMNEQLQSTNEVMETTNEELQSTNEELITTNEELESTNEELETTNEELQTLNQELRYAMEEKERVEQELQLAFDREHNIAETLQQALLPHIAGRIGDLSVAVKYTAAFDEAEVGGDFYHSIPLVNSQHVFMLGDVSGKGLESAVLGSMAGHMAMGFLSETPSPELLLLRLNDALSAYRMEGRFITFVYLLADLASNRIYYGGAGHEPVIHYSAAQDTVTSLMPTGPALGIIPGAQFSSTAVEMGEGDVVFVYTDGLSEAGPVRSPLALDGLSHLVKEHASKEPAALLEIIYDAAIKLSGGKLRDDAASLLIKRVG